ncbi:hypothetical protein [Flavobacterium sp.]|uniref:hypothetical protein n=1 Tax=Flavobacterium sp. TaxID=239 RepID=UPI0031D3EE10
MKKKLDQFVNDYIETWSTVDSQIRKRLVEKVYSNSAEFFVNQPEGSPTKHSGAEAIFKNISNVNERMVIGDKLETEFTGYSENHDTLKVTWQMKTINGEIVVKGMDFLQLENSKIIKDYLFIN